MGLTVFYRVLPGFAGLNWVLMGSTRFKRDFIAYQQKEPEKLFYWSFLGFFRRFYCLVQVHEDSKEF